MAVITTGNAPKAIGGVGVAKTRFNPSGGVTAASRRSSQKAGHTMKGGSFPINDRADLARAKHDVGRAKNPAAARRWINKRAHELGAPKLGQRAAHHHGAHAHHP
jgi:hypothetical protein